jgi:hypothetical protein
MTPLFIKARNAWRGILILLNSVFVETPVVDALLKIDRHSTERGQAPPPIEPRINVCGTNRSEICLKAHPYLILDDGKAAMLELRRRARSSSQSALKGEPAL